MRLSAAAKRNKINMVSHAILQNLVIKSLNIIVRDIAEVIQMTAVKTNGGFGKINCMKFRMITAADNAGYFNTSLACSSSFKRFCD
jgi:hypothetical protein